MAPGRFAALRSASVISSLPAFVRVHLGIVEREIAISEHPVAKEMRRPRVDAADYPLAVGLHRGVQPSDERVNAGVELPPCFTDEVGSLVMQRSLLAEAQDAKPSLVLGTVANDVE
jgi:hypothetical protein